MTSGAGKMKHLPSESLNRVGRARRVVSREGEGERRRGRLIVGRILQGKARGRSRNVGRMLQTKGSVAAPRGEYS